MKSQNDNPPLVSESMTEDLKQTEQSFTKANVGDQDIKDEVSPRTYNRLDRLKRVLDGLEKQTYSLTDFEVVVVSDGSPDGTDDYLRTLETPLRLTAVFQPNQGVAVARNHGLERATGELVLFVDDDRHFLVFSFE